MKRELQLTADGSHTVGIPELNITYHSIHGAVQESRHVFIEAGLKYALSKFTIDDHTCLRIFEMGFGTGLNALLSFAEAKAERVCLHYETVEIYPLSAEEAEALNYVSVLKDVSLEQPYLQMHHCAPDKNVIIAPFFVLHKSNTSLPDVTWTERFHLVYFDAFAADVQPGLWTTGVFRKMYEMLYDGGALVTYCSKGSVRRAMQEAGFMIEKLKGAPGKREMVRAVKRQAE